MTLTEIITSVRRKLDDEDYDEAVITEAANFFVNELYNNVRTRQMETTATISIAQNDTVGALPTDFHLLLSLRSTSPTVASMTGNMVPYEEFNSEYPGYDSSTAAAIYRFTVFGNALRFSSPVNAAYTLKLDYLRKPVQMTVGSDVCEVPDSYKELVIIGTLARVMERNEDYAEASQERGNLDSLMIAFIRNEGRGQIASGPTIIRSAFGRGRTRRWEDA